MDESLNLCCVWALFFDKYPSDTYHNMSATVINQHIAQCPLQYMHLTTSATIYVSRTVCYNICISPRLLQYMYLTLSATIYASHHVYCSD